MTTRDRIAVTVIAAALLIAGFWFLLLGPERQKASKLGTQLTQERQRLASAQSDAADSRTAQAQYARNYATVAQLGKAVPATDDVPSLVYQLSSTAQSSDVDFRTIKLQDSSTGAAAAAPSSGSSGGSSGSGASGGSGGSGGSNGSSKGSGGSNGSGAGSGASGAGSGASGSSAQPAAAAQAATATLPPGAVVGPAGFPTMPFSFTFEGSFFRLSTFFARLEGLIRSQRNAVTVHGRLLTIDGLALTSAPQGFPRMKAAVAATAYLLPADQGLTNGATPSAPPAASAQPASTTKTTTATPPAATAGAVR